MTVERVIASYRRMLSGLGETVIIRRGTGTASLDVSARARVTGFRPEELVGDINQGDRKIILLAEDVAAIAPLKPDFRVMVRGQPLRILAVDDSSRRVGGVLVAYELLARGG